MQNVEAQQRVGVHLVPAQQQKAHVLAQQRHGRGDVAADGNRPVRQLVPGQQIPGVAQQQREQQQKTPITQLNSRGGRYAPR